MKKWWFVLALALLLFGLVSCVPEGHVNVTGRVIGLWYVDGGYLRYHLDSNSITFSDEKSHDGAEYVDVPITNDSKSVGLDEDVTVNCYFNDVNSIPINACSLVSHGK